MAGENLVISDLITPDIWRDYGMNRSRELSNLWQSGIMSKIQGLTIPKGGAVINLPHFNGLKGKSQNLSDSKELETKKMSAGKQMAVVVGRGDAWSYNDLAGVLAGADPAKALVDGLAQYWAEQDQAELINMLGGVFSADTMSGNVLDISAEKSGDALFSADTFLDALQKLGDASHQLTAVAMHSITRTQLAKKNLIQTVRFSDSSAEVDFYMGKRVIVDDSMPVSKDGVFTTYLFGAGAVGYDEAPLGQSEIETDRNILSANNILAMRKHFVMHVSGTSWNGTSADVFPSREELGYSANWSRVFEAKKIPVIAFKHRNFMAVTKK